MRGALLRYQVHGGTSAENTVQMGTLCSCSIIPFYLPFFFRKIPASSRPDGGVNFVSPVHLPSISMSIAFYEYEDLESKMSRILNTYEALSYSTKGGESGRLSEPMVGADQTIISSLLRSNLDSAMNHLFD